MLMQDNAFKRALKSGDVQFGLFLALADSYSAELLATTGFDWLLIDGEHGPNDLRSILRQLQAVAPWPGATLVRMPDHNPTTIKQLLDAGVQNLLVPMVESADQARALVQATRYPPAGVRGVATAMARAAQWNGVSDYMDRANDEICLIVQMESVAGLHALDEILAVDGVDAVFIGPADLAASMGYPGQSGQPQVEQAVLDSLPRIIAAGKAAGIFSGDMAGIQRYRDHGANFIGVGIDTLLLRHAATQLLQQCKGGAATPAGASY
ncbi:MAG: HpcH/HpaI aldolase/citrate lyase family protein [Burkholderiaceae bacterium]|nr:HpcH/HpaI aldolase/citrate lyase family protein [Burkholderiaceae bacterium]